MKKVKLFCFPYAGGSSVIYHNWVQHLSPTIELKPIELAGRGRRVQDKMYGDLEELIEDVYTLTKDEIRGSAYAFFGHSMGAMIAYELAHRVRREGFHNPGHLFFSGRGAPHIPREDDKKYSLMSADDFKQEVLKLGGTPREFFEHPELMELFLPLLQNDFKLSESELLEAKNQPLNVDISAFFGEEEDLTIEQREGWERHTLKKYESHCYKGGHFFINEEVESISNVINQKIRDSF